MVSEKIKCGICKRNFNEKGYPSHYKSCKKKKWLKTLGWVVIVITVLSFLYPFNDIIKEKVDLLLLEPRNLDLSLTRTFWLDDLPTWSIGVQEVLLVRGCNTRQLVFGRIASPNFPLGKEIQTVIHGDSDCSNCTFHGISISNLGKKIEGDLLFYVNTSGDLDISKADPQVEIIGDYDPVTENSLLINIADGMKEEGLIQIQAISQKYIDVDVDCNLIKKANCSITKVDIAITHNQEGIDFFLRNNNIPEPWYNGDQLKVFQLTSEHDRFEEIPGVTHLSRDVFCKDGKDSEVPYFGEVFPSTPFATQ
jgi:hypothetical protein